MSGRERRTRVPLEGLSEDRLDLLREAANDALIGQAGDLAFLEKGPDPRQSIREVAVLGRLAPLAPDHGEVPRPRPGRPLIGEERKIAGDARPRRPVVQARSLDAHGKSPLALVRVTGPRVTSTRDSLWTRGQSKVRIFT